MKRPPLFGHTLRLEYRSSARKSGPFLLLVNASCLLLVRNPGYSVAFFDRYLKLAPATDPLVPLIKNPRQGVRLLKVNAR
jgi:hypothetical protein